MPRGSSSSSVRPAAEQPRPKRVSREAWVDRVADYVLENGSAKLSVRALALQYGVSPQALSKHFGSREQLLSEAMQRALERDSLALERMVGGMDSIAGLLEQIIEGLGRETFRRMLAAQAELFATASMTPEDHSNFPQRCTRLGTAALVEQARRDGIPEARAKSVADMLMASVRGLIMSALGGWTPAQTRGVARQILSWYRSQIPQARAGDQ